MTRPLAPLGRLLASFALAAVASGLACAPLVAEHVVESVGFSDHLGAFPVDVSLLHNGTSTVDAGVFGRLYWDRTGAFGFGALLRVTGPPEADGSSLASYITPDFLRTNAAFVNEPGEVARAYGAQLRSDLLTAFLRTELVVALVGGALLTLAFRGRAPLRSLPPGRRAIVCLVLLVASTASSVAAAGWMLEQWEGSAPVEDALPMPGVPELSFSSPQAREIAVQVRPFIEKNTRRIRERSDAYAAAAETSLREALAGRSSTLAPRPGEKILLAEADPQGSFVGQRVREDLYALLQEQLEEDALAVRAIAGDVTSNGTVAEESYVRAEAGTTPDVPVVAVKGDHDTETTVEQLAAEGILNPHLDPAEVGGLRLVVGNDPAFKTLLGGLVVNDTGTTEAERGTELRRVVDEVVDAEGAGTVVLLHQPESAAAYADVESLEALGGTDDLTTPHDDGIPDLPPGIIEVGHLHDPAPPRVIWNTDTDEVTWTVVNQLGTAGGVEENPTFNRFSTPFSTPLKDLTVQLQYVDVARGLQTGYVELTVTPTGTVSLSERTDLGDVRPGDGAGGRPSAGAAPPRGPGGGTPR